MITLIITTVFSIFYNIRRCNEEGVAFFLRIDLLTSKEKRNFAASNCQKSLNIPERSEQ